MQYLQHAAKGGSPPARADRAAPQKARISQVPLDSVSVSWNGLPTAHFAAAADGGLESVSEPGFFSPSGRSTLVADGATLLKAAELAGEPLRAECGGRGACGRCLVRILDGQIPEYRVLQREDGFPQALACLTPVHGPLTVSPLVEAQLPKLVSRDRAVGLAPLEAWAPWPLELAPIIEPVEAGDWGWHWTSAQHRGSC
jgi:ferredoxin